jgi:hypothetical protein
MLVTVGYKLVDAQDAVLNQWGGTVGVLADPPNPLALPNGDHVCAPELDTDYGGYRLISWQIEVPDNPVPEYVTSAQARLLLLSQNLLDQAEALIAQQSRSAQIEWQYRDKFYRNSSILLSTAEEMNLTSEQIDQFFIAAAVL